MIQLTRVRTVEAIYGGLKGRYRKQKEKKLLENQRTYLLNGTPHSFRNSYWTHAKPQLKKETGGLDAKCAYCESPVTATAHGDVEHFRPKSIYWWLAYCYDNFLFACQICNQLYKGDHFPINTNQRMSCPIAILANTTDPEISTMAGNLAPDPLNDAEGLPMLDFITHHNTENPNLLNPYFINPETYFAWSADDNLREVSLIPVNNMPNAPRYVDAANRYYGLNRVELKRMRYARYSFYITLKRTLEELAISVNLTNRIRLQIQEMQADNAPFAAMIRYFERQ